MNAFSLPVADCVLIPVALRAARRDRVLADEALQHVRVQFWRGLCNPTRAFLPWATTVLRNYCCDALKHRLRAVGGDEFSERPVRLSDLSTVEGELDLTTPFCATDRAAVLAWKPRPRFVLLAWHGLWNKLPPADQQETLAAVRPTVPFPVPGFFDRTARERTRYLADALACRPNSVVKIRLANLERLTSLRFVRELCERSPV